MLLAVIIGSSRSSPGRFSIGRSVVRLRLTLDGPVSAARWKALDHGYRLALHRKVWLRQAEGARGPYVHGDLRPIARYPADDLHSLAQEALRRRPPAANDAEGAVIVARFLGFTTVPSEDLAVLIAAARRAGLIRR